MKTRILLVHNHYGSSVPSGENQVVKVEQELLLQHGHEVKEFFRFSDEIISQGAWGAMKGALSTPWNLYSALAIKRFVQEFLPDVVHAHNTFPMLSPAIFHSIGTRAARVLTLHNYRLYCSAAVPMRDGKVCTECIDESRAWPALKYGCYRNSRLATIPLALSVALHRKLGTWSRQVDAFIVLSQFQRDLMIDAGLPAELVHVKPNFYPGNPIVPTWQERKPYAVFAGRLTAEKGVESLVRAWMMWGPSAPELHIVGDGALKSQLMKLASADPAVPIKFTGQLDSSATQKEIAFSQLLILPSQCFEGFPMVVREAFAFGTPVAVSDLGPLPSIITEGVNGVVFASGNPHSLLEIVRNVWESHGTLEVLGQGARTAYKNMFTGEINYQMMAEIYQQAIEVSLKRRGRLSA